MSAGWNSKLRGWAAAAALFCASGAAAALALEGLARLWVKVPPPVELRAGVFVSSLPLINGHPSCRWTPTVKGPPLPRAARPGELRVFVFGESSVQGSPWDYPGSPATMLRDRLEALIPGRDVTVVNMGRSCSSMMDSYYYLLASAPYRPDVVVFYQGSNDRFDADRERCMPQTRPLIHAAWRFLAARSRALWAARALAPRAIRNWEDRALREPAPPGEPGCDPAEGFAAWTRILIREAKGLGARVIVTSPVRNPLLPLEMRAWTREPRTVAEAVRGLAPDYREALRCELTAGCAPRDAGASAGRSEIEARAEAWKASARGEGAVFVDFRPRASGGLFVGETHLTLDGYWSLASLWAGAVAGREEAAAPPRGRRYDDDLRAAGSPVEDVFYSEGLAYLRARMLLLAAPSLRRAAERGVTDARLVTAGLRRAAGLPSGIAGDLKARFARFDLDGHLRRPPSPSGPAPAAMPASLRAAMDLFAKEDWQGAESAASKVLAREPSNGTALLLRGAAFQHAGRPLEALADFTALVDARPEPAVLADALSNRGQALQRLGRGPEAAKDYARALAVAPPGWPQRASVESLLAAAR